MISSKLKNIRRSKKNLEISCKRHRWQREFAHVANQIQHKRSCSTILPVLKSRPSIACGRAVRRINMHCSNHRKSVRFNTCTSSVTGRLCGFCWANTYYNTKVLPTDRGFARIVLLCWADRGMKTEYMKRRCTFIPITHRGLSLLTFQSSFQSIIMQFRLRLSQGWIYNCFGALMYKRVACLQGKFIDFFCFAS